MPKGTKQEAMQSVLGYIKQIGIDFLKEGGSESVTFIVSELADSLYEGDFDNFNIRWAELIDTFLIGGAFGAQISGVGGGATFIRQGAANRKINKG